MKKYIYSSFLVVMVVSIMFHGCSLEEEGPDPASTNPVVSEITPVQAASNEVLTLKGNGLGDIRSVIFETDSVSAMINPTLNTGNALIFRVPADAVPGNQKIIFTNGKGVEFSVAFNVLGYANITEVSNYNFNTGDEITLIGQNLADVTGVTFAEGGTTVDIVSKTATTLTIKMPETDVIETSLNIENLAGVAITDQVFVNREQAFVIFDDAYGAGYQDASWGAAGTISTDVFKSGSAAVYKDYAAANWHLLGFGWTNTKNDNFKYLSFWIKGASADYDLYIQSQQSPSVWDTFSDFNKIAVPANEWTYFKIPVDQLQLWANGTEWNQLAWRIQGPDGQDERFYLDDVMFIY